jgi:hypothetical protein
MNDSHADIWLSPEQMDLLWKRALPYMACSPEDVLEAALSGDDPEAALAHLFWLRRSLAQNSRVPESTRAFAVEALDRFGLGKGGLSLGQAFGLERRKRGAPPRRLGAVRAINGLLRFLHEKEGYPVIDPKIGPSTFDVAAALLKRYWGFDRSPYTLSDEPYWQKGSQKKR